MDIYDLLRDETADWLRYPPVIEEALDAFIRQTGLSFPEEYLTLLRYSNGGEGELGIQPCWFIIESVEDLPELNEVFPLQDELPGYFAFGTNGGNEVFVFNTREEQPWKVYYVPMIVMSQGSILYCTRDFRSFIELMGRSNIDGSCE